MPKFINLYNMSSALTLNANNALFVANFLDILSAEIKSHIVEFNTEHRKAMSKVFDQLVRYVFCPSYYNSVEDEALFPRRDLDDVNQELHQIRHCLLCNKIKESHVLLKQIKIGLWLEDGQPNMSDDVNFCGECYHDVRHWDRTKYVKHYVIGGGRNVMMGYPFDSWSYISPNDTMETIIKSFDMQQKELDRYEKRMPDYIYDNACDNLNNEREYLIDLYERTHTDTDTTDDEYDEGYDSY